jgi:hypothetical protein
VPSLAALCHAPLSFQVKTIAGQPFLDLTDWRQLTGLQELSLQVRLQQQFTLLRILAQACAIPSWVLLRPATWQQPLSAQTPHDANIQFYPLYLDMPYSTAEA